MLKKTVLAVAAGIVCSLCSSMVHAEVEYKLINSYRYYKTMYEAALPTDYMSFAFGSGNDNIGGYEEDAERNTEGLPNAFRVGSEKGQMWILDNVNAALKLFYYGKCTKSIDIKKFENIHDFTVSSSGKIAFLNRDKGIVFVTDDKGEVTSEFKGFECANSIEFTADDDMLIFSPLAGGVARVSVIGALKDMYKADDSLSTYETEKGIWGIEHNYSDVAKLYIRTGVEPENVKILAEIPFKDFKDVVYKGAEIYGFDAEGNVHFGLVATDPDGIIYRERLYKCSPDGKILSEKDVIAPLPAMSPSLPRHRVVTPDGTVIGFYADGKNYYLCKW